MNTFGGVFVMQDVLKNIEEHESELRERLEGQLSKEDVSWDYLQTTGNIENIIVAQGSFGRRDRGRS